MSGETKTGMPRSASLDRFSEIGLLLVRAWDDVYAAAFAVEDDLAVD
jgi:hypothetical protein